MYLSTYLYIYLYLYLYIYLYTICIYRYLPIYISIYIQHVSIYLSIYLFIYLETLVSPEQFAQVLCDDLDLPSTSFVPAIAQSIKQQIDQFSPDMIPQDEEDRRVIIKVSSVSKFQ